MASSIGGLTTKLRRVVASAVVSSYGYLLFLFWAVPQSVLFMQIGKESPSVVWTAILPMTIFPLGFQLLPRRMYDLQKFEHDGRLYRCLGVRRVRFFVGLGEGIQRLARSIDPQWQSPLAKLTCEERIQWTRRAEGIHWGFLFGSVPLIAMTFYLGYATLGIGFCLVNVPFNVYPIMLQRYSRAKLMRIRELQLGRAEQVDLGANQVKGQPMNGAKASLFCGWCLLLLGCGATHSPDEQFKAIVDAKRVQMNEWLVANKPDLARAVAAVFDPKTWDRIDVKGEITDVKDIDARLDHPYVGTITIVIPTEVHADGVTHDPMTATYWYSAKTRRWTYQGITRNLGNRLPMNPPITFEEAKSAFEME